MSNNEILYTPLQINGAIMQGESTPEKLFPRELYITAEGKLIIGNPLSNDQQVLTTSSKITVDTALDAKGVSFEKDERKIDTEKGIIEKFNINSSTINTSTIKDSTLQGSINNAEGTIEGGTLKNNTVAQAIRLNVSEKCYGETLPENAKVGDIFIKI